MIDLLIENGFIVVPLGVLLAAVAGLLARQLLYELLVPMHPQWPYAKSVVDTMWQPFLHWFILFGAYVAIGMSTLPPTLKVPGTKILASLLILSLTWAAVRLSERLAGPYLSRLRALQLPTGSALIITKVTGTYIAVLLILVVWSAPTGLVLLALGAGVFIAALGLRDIFADFVYGFQIGRKEQPKVGEFIELESGEAGHVTRITWRNMAVKTLEGNLVLIPNRRLARAKLANYGTDASRYTVQHTRKETPVEAPKPVNMLSEREKEVLALVGRGATNHEIAQKLFISDYTVKSHIRSILNKLSLRNRQQAAVYAEREGLVEAIKPGS